MSQYLLWGLGIVVIVGPTGAGKTRLSLDLAERANGEVISCDSQQVYVGMDIGTGKVTTAERARVPHHVLDIVRPDEEMTAARCRCSATATGRCARWGRFSRRRRFTIT